MNENKNHDWTTTQFHSMMKLWSGAIERHYPEHLDAWTKPEKFVDNLQNYWNLLDAAKKIEWEELFKGKNSLKVLDLGCGTGWLSAYLSNFSEIAEIDCLDADEKNLNVMLPEVIKLLKGDINKINPVLGLFSPILRPDSYYDVIVTSSAIHHSENIILLLKELKRTLKPDGKLVILNETPYTTIKYLRFTSRIMVNLLFKMLFSKKLEFSQLISSRGVLYDPYLGDWTMSMSLWKRMFELAELKHSVVESGLFPYKNASNQSVRLVHFICQL